MVIAHLEAKPLGLGDVKLSPGGPIAGRRGHRSAWSSAFRAGAHPLPGTAAAARSARARRCMSFSVHEQPPHDRASRDFHIVRNRNAVKPLPARGAVQQIHVARPQLDRKRPAPWRLKALARQHQQGALAPDEGGNESQSVIMSGNQCPRRVHSHPRQSVHSMSPGPSKALGSSGSWLLSRRSLS